MSLFQINCENFHVNVTQVVTVLLAFLQSSQGLTHAWGFRRTAAADRTENLD